MPKQFWRTQQILFTTYKFGKPYVWMKDVDGTIHLMRLDNDGEPVVD